VEVRLEFSPAVEAAMFEQLVMAPAAQLSIFPRL
jgi:hypothetical protein